MRRGKEIRVGKRTGRAVVAALLMTAGLLAAFPAGAEIGFTSAWIVGSSRYPTGAGWADVNGDGWPDLVIANGLDVANHPNEVYFNRNGAIEREPGWVSEDTLASGNLCLVDLDGDGDPDMVNANLGFAAEGKTAQPHTAYRNDGGSFGAAPFWRSVPGNAFSLAVGDPDGDGDVDVAFGQGFSAVDPRNAKRQKVVVYFNEGKGFAGEPGWESDSSYVTVDIAFGDVNADGWQDLAITGRGMGIRIFMNRDGRLETTPSWTTSAILGGRQMAFGDVEDDGYADLAVCEVGEYGRGEGCFVLFRNRGGELEKTPSWRSDRYPEASALAWGDADGDGDLDLAGGGWAIHAGVFENRNGVLTREYVWRHEPGWVQQVAWCDFDENGLVPEKRVFTGDGRRSFFDLGEKAIHEIRGVAVDGRALPRTRWCSDPLEGWLSLAEAPRPGATLSVAFVRSTDLDLAVTTIDRIRLYENRPSPTPRDVRVLALVDDGYGANLALDYVHPLLGRVNHNILTLMERRGWEVDFAGVKPTVAACSSLVDYCPSDSMRVDRLVSAIDDLSAYDALVVMPGLDHTGLLASPEAMELVRRAAREGLVIGGWCRGVKVLAAAGVLRGRRVAGPEAMRELLEAAGAIYEGEDAWPVTDANVVTVKRSRYYRPKMVDAIGLAVKAAREGA
ncbi:MAG: VCBS repeat-containing protein [Candidatus Eisenbacteria bacterium]|nr:VCBS repeat-containing protein [Candidatus Eisenbacteria bacterium]